MRSPCPYLFARMPTCETLVRHARVIDGTGAAPFVADVAISDGIIAEVAPGLTMRAEHEVDAAGLCLAPGFIDVHTHDDTNVVRTPEMWPKLSQGVTTVSWATWQRSSPSTTFDSRSPVRASSSRVFTKAAVPS